MEGTFSIEALCDALADRRPEIFNSDQGSQFTAVAFNSQLVAAGVAINMDSRGRCLDNVFTEAAAPALGKGLAGHSPTLYTLIKPR